MSSVQLLAAFQRERGLERASLSKLLSRELGVAAGSGLNNFDAFEQDGFRAAWIQPACEVELPLATDGNVAVLLNGAPTAVSGARLAPDRILAWARPGADALLARLGEIRGVFALVAFFRRERRLLVVRDRLGLVPIFVASAATHGVPLIVGSSARVTAEASGRVRANEALLSRYVLCRYDEVFGHEPTFYEGVRLLQPAAVLDSARSDGGRRYWSFSELGAEAALDARPEPEALASHLLRATADAVLETPAAGGGGEPILALSSGLDSTCVAATCAKLGQPLASFTIRYDVGTPLDECSAAGEAADLVCSRWTPLTLHAEEFLAAWAKAYSMHEQPLATSSCLGYDLMAQKVRELGYERIVTGGSGDDLFAGNYPAYLHHLADLFVGRSERFSAELAAWAALHGTQQFSKDAGVFWEFLARNVDVSLPGRVTPKPQLLDPGSARAAALHAAAFAAPPVSLHAGSYLQAYAAYGVWYSAKPPGLLPCLEAARQHDVEFLDPFVDEALVAFAWNLAPEWKIREGRNKVIVRQVMREWLPASLTDRTDKIGYDVPFGVWLRRPDFRQFVADVLGSASHAWLRDVLDVDRVRASVCGESDAPVPPMLVWQATNAALWRATLV